MRNAVAVVVLLLLQAVPAAVADMQITFELPARFQANDVRVSGSQWAILVFDQDNARLDATFDAARQVENTSRLYPLRIYSSTFDVSPYRTEEKRQDEVAKGSLSISPRIRSSVVVRAESIEFNAGHTGGTLDELVDSRSAADFMRPTDDEAHLYRPPAPNGDHVVIALQDSGNGIPFMLSVLHPLSVEWFAADISCSAHGWCPSGGGLSAMRLPNLGEANATMERYSYESLQEPDALVGQGYLDYAVLGGSKIDFEMNGTIRLPVSSGTSCAGCVVPQDQTLTASGHVILSGLQPSGEKRLAGTMAGDLESVQFDEDAVNPALLAGLGVAGAAAIAGGVLAVKTLLGALFTRFYGRDSLESPRRRLLYETVVANPGVGFNQLIRLTGLASGSVRHHVNFLVRERKVVERRQGFSLRYFENHGKYDHDWMFVAALRDDKLKALHEWLKGQGGEVNQKDALDTWEGHGWSRSSTQHRLDRLEAKGLLAVRWQGRRKFYRVNAN